MGLILAPLVTGSLFGDMFFDMPIFLTFFLYKKEFVCGTLHTMIYFNIFSKFLRVTLPWYICWLFVFISSRYSYATCSCMRTYTPQIFGSWPARIPDFWTLPIFNFWDIQRTSWWRRWISGSHFFQSGQKMVRFACTRLGSNHRKPWLCHESFCVVCGSYRSSSIKLLISANARLSQIW